MKKNLITTALLLSASAFSYAQSATTELPAINVYSAYATPVNQDQTASSVTVLTEQDFASRNATYVSDVLKTVPGVAISAAGGRGALTNFYLRGADANHTVVVIDGVKVNPVSGYGYDFGGLSLSNIERIEVLRGEQSALWGSDAMGGVIYITTKSGLYKDKPFNVDFDLGVGSHRTRDSSVTVSGYNEGFYYSVHGDSHRTSGISALSQDRFHYTAEDHTAVTTGGANEKDKFHRDNTSARFGYDDGSKGIELLSSHYSQTVNFDNNLTDEKHHYTRTRETLFKLGGYWGSDKDRFKHRVAVSHIKTKSDTFGFNSNYEGKKFNANYQLDINFDQEGAITQGLSLFGEYQRTDYQSSYFNNIGEKKLTEKSIAAEYRLFSENDHSLSLSGRYTNSSEYENSFTGRLSGTYRFTPNLKVHASVGSAIQNPTITEYYGYNGRYIGNPNLKPEKSRGGDVGVLLETHNKQHSLDITYFHRRVENFISSEIIDFTTYISRAINLDGKTKIKGVEIAYRGKLTDDLTAYANYTYTNSKESNGRTLLRRPKHTANAGLSYQITEKWGSDVNVSYVGKRTDNYFSPTYSTHRTQLPSYTLVNLGVNYQVIPNLTLYANLNNLFDKKYENTLGYGQDGRNLYVGLRGSF
ncbi:TonB-dependent receptor plug domain-containing protein [Rodentibacter heidelbergensis]|uniref:Cobalamin receptor n=1 Tax=Rodentibacter heidelbergensis TaxID=1908258 RepID=A0A1V3IA41_9PAST|nr:TonB-dependent receptor [Rodentibacter heidelbergensis]OOF36907.1 cobalamin receptor [Rodentibacter heidelbergensis]